MPRRKKHDLSTGDFVVFTLAKKRGPRQIEGRITVIEKAIAVVRLANGEEMRVAMRLLTKQR